MLIFLRTSISRKERRGGGLEIKIFTSAVGTANHSPFNVAAFLCRLPLPFLGRPFRGKASQKVDRANVTPGLSHKKYRPGRLPAKSSEAFVFARFTSRKVPSVLKNAKQTLNDELCNEPWGDLGQIAMPPSCASNRGKNGKEIKIKIKVYPLSLSGSGGWRLRWLHILP
jgi:hypothetical protein